MERGWNADGTRMDRGFDIRRSHQLHSNEVQGYGWNLAKVPGYDPAKIMKADGWRVVKDVLMRLMHASDFQKLEEKLKETGKKMTKAQMKILRQAMKGDYQAMKGDYEGEQSSSESETETST